MLELKSGIDGSIDDYKRIEGLSAASDRQLALMASEESLLVDNISQRWQAYRSRIEDLSILVSDPSFSA
jgi:hypothetical protein